MGDSPSLSNSYNLRTDDETRAHYDAWAETYDEELADNDYAQPSRCAEALVQVQGDRTALILDVGCGTGLSGIALRDVGYSTIDGCDFSPGMLEKAREVSVYRNLFEANLNEPLKIEDDSYGGVAAVGVFSFGHIQADAVDELCRIIQPGGGLVIGLNALFYDEGTVKTRMDKLETAGTLSSVVHEHGDHLPGRELSGWVFRAIVN
jgi:predicted TPR repeat methyltransferase